MQAVQAGKLRAKSADYAFLTRGFQNWKDATRTFRFHEKSTCHVKAVEKVITLPETTKHIGELLSSQVAKDRKRNRASLLHILRALRYLARQGLSLRGSSLTHETNGNFTQLLQLFCTLDEGLPSWLKKTRQIYKW